MSSDLRCFDGEGGRYVNVGDLVAWLEGLGESGEALLALSAKWAAKCIRESIPEPAPLPPKDGEG